MKLFFSTKQKLFSKKAFLSGRRGFTLVELLVAAAILVTATGAPLYLGIQGVIIATEAKDRISATFLAGEGIELIRNRRDSNILVVLDELRRDPSAEPSRTWKTGFAENVASPSPTCLIISGNNTGCVVGRNVNDMVDESIVVHRCNNTECPNLQRVTVSGQDRFGYPATLGSGTGADSGFKRTIQVTEVGSGGDEIKVSVTVEWDSRGAQREITVEEHLFDYGT